MLPFFKKQTMANPAVDLRDELEKLVVGHLTITFREDLPQIINKAYQQIMEDREDKVISMEDKVTANTPQSTLMSKTKVQSTITPDYLICLEDGAHLKFLKRHLKAYFNMTPQQYIEKWGLPHNYPLVAPNYSKHRSNMAKKYKLGQSRSKIDTK